ncbi:hypothetical protein RUM43_007467 [Polyplax serrata]|uniref:Uncharacterized protein n=1 Tax=Polyplax serrata TaxID=468196 RepID=A0AAN8S7W1_POLSC
MKLLILLLSFRYLLVSSTIHYYDDEVSYEEVSGDYTGYERCGYNGWSCLPNNEIAFECYALKPEARIWIWTARLPNPTTTFTVKNCHTVQVHVDCTSGPRSNTIQRFKVINVTDLRFLKPTPHGRYLHDNLAIPKLPSTVILENIKNVTMFSGIFDRPSKSCSNDKINLMNLRMSNVHIDKIPVQLFSNININEFILENVSVDSVETNAISVVTNFISIRGSTFPDLPNNAIQLFVRDKVLILSNSFRKIEINALNVRSKIFKFSENYVDEINTQAFNIIGNKMEISKNRFNHLDTRAFEKISFGVTHPSFDLASRFVYNFSGNALKNIEPGALHPNWTSFKNNCFELFMDNNEFECSCVHFGWTTVPNGFGQRINSNKEFYELYVYNSTTNKCSENKACSLKTFIAHVQDLCVNKTDLQTICSDKSVDYASTSEEKMLLSQESEVPPPPPSPQTQERNIFQIDKIKLTNYTARENQDYVDIKGETAPLIYYSENPTSENTYHKTQVWWAIGMLIFIVCLTYLGIFTWWYKKNRKKQNITTKYTNQKETDADSLIIINEHNNRLFHENNEAQLE